MKRKQLESLLSALIPTLRHFIERQIESAATQLKGVLDQRIAALPKPKDGVDGKSVTIDDVKPLIADTIAEAMPKSETIAKAVLAAIEVPAPPSAKEVAAELEKSFPTVEAVADIARNNITVPTAEEIAKLVPVPAVPTAEEVAKLVQTPSADAIVDAVMTKVKIPTAQEIAREIPVPSVELRDDTPTRDEVSQQIGEVKAAIPTVEAIVGKVIDSMPTAADVAKLVELPQVEIPELPDAPTREEVTQQIEQLKATIPTAADVAKLVELPELPTLPELPEIPTAEEIAKLCVPMLPEPPSVEEVVEALKHHIPQPVKGDKGDPGERGESVDIAAVITEVTRLNESNFAKWALDFERRALDRVDAFLRSIEKPRDGVDGKDGLGFDDLRNVKAEQIDDRIVRISVQRGEESIHLVDIKLSHPLHKGVFVEGVEYARGDQVTRDGCAWIALKESPQGKPGSSDDWQLAVKKGRDGRDGDDPDKKGPPRVRIPPRK